MHMSDNQNPEQEKNDDKKAFKTRNELQNRTESRPYFEKIRKLKENSQRLKQKADNEMKRVREMMKRKKEELKAAKNKTDKKLIQADYHFLRGALRELPSLKFKITGDITKMNLILATKIKMPYRVMVDFELKPLPSQRQKNKDRDQDKDKGKKNSPNDKNNDKANGQNSGKNNRNQANSQKENRQKLRQDILALSLQGINRNLTPAAPQKRPVQQTNINYNNRLLQNLFNNGRM